MSPGWVNGYYLLPGLRMLILDKAFMELLDQGEVVLVMEGSQGLVADIPAVDPGPVVTGVPTEAVIPGIREDPGVGGDGAGIPAGHGPLRTHKVGINLVPAVKGGSEVSLIIIVGHKNREGCVVAPVSGVKVGVLVTRAYRQAGAEKGEIGSHDEATGLEIATEGR